MLVPDLVTARQNGAGYAGVFRRIVVRNDLKFLDRFGAGIAPEAACALPETSLFGILQKIKFCCARAPFTESLSPGPPADVPY